MRTFPYYLILIFTAAEQRVNYSALSSVPAVPVQWRFIRILDILMITDIQHKPGK